MKYYCPSCKHLVGDIIGQMRKGAIIVCARCFKRYQIADNIAKLAREQTHSDPAVEQLMNMFNMKP